MAAGGDCRGGEVAGDFRSPAGRCCMLPLGLRPSPTRWSDRCTKRSAVGAVPKSVCIVAALCTTGVSFSRVAAAAFFFWSFVAVAFHART